jgi:hypothetical protein
MSELSKEKPLPFYADIANCADMMGADNVSSEEMDNTWEYILAEANRLNKLRPFRERLELLVERIKDSGGINWAASLLSQPSIENDPLTSRQWRQAWEWARGKGYVKVLSTREHVEMLKERHRRLENHKENVMGELVRIRTFIGLKQNITGTISSALQQFAMHVRLLGAGTGKSAERRRRAIRESTIAAAGAVPCWILPEWRVAEQLPSELGLFDLVIIDEASQSNITSLPILLRGKKLLVVGDDKQVSPSAVGMEERVVVQLRETYLKGTAAENFLEPTTSLYDFASIIFPESVIMLREHFRCVPEIIGFSNRFYAKDLIPMRMATKDTVITPPLRDVYLPEGLKKNDKHKAEAKYIVSEIKR